jgi:hypothetical protein
MPYLANYNLDGLTIWSSHSVHQWTGLNVVLSVANQHVMHLIADSRTARRCRAEKLCMCGDWGSIDIFVGPVEMVQRSSRRLFEYYTTWLAVLHLLVPRLRHWDRLGVMALCLVLDSCSLLAWYVFIYLLCLWMMY